MGAALRVATVGAGYFSQFHHDAWQRLGVRLVGVCDRDERKAATFAERYGADAHYSDVNALLDQARPDLVDIVTPPDTHLELIDLVTERGIAAVCQKPFTDSIEQAREAVAIAQTRRATVVVHENFRFQPWYEKIKSLIDEEVLGEIYQITFRLRPGDGQGPRAYLDRQPYFQSMERFLIRETGIHFIDVFRYLLGEVEAVQAHLVRLNPSIKGEDAGIVLFEFTRGTRALFDANRLADHPAANTRLTMGEMNIEGELGSITLDGYGRLHRRLHGRRVADQIPFECSEKGFGGDCVLRLQKHVVDHFSRGTVLVNRADEYLANLFVQEAIYLANERHARITLRSDRG